MRRSSSLRHHADGQVLAAGREDVGERLPDHLFDLVGAVDRQRAVELHREDAEVVEPEQVVDVVVRVDDRMDELHLLAEQLQPQFGRGVDEDVAARACR